MASSNQKSNLAANFTLEQQALISEIVKTEISELIASGGLVCSHSSSSSQVPWLPADSKISVPTTPYQQPANKLQQFIDNCSDTESSTSNPSINSVATNLSTSAVLFDKLACVEQRLIALECRFIQFESSMGQSSSLNPENKSVDSTRLLEDMHADFETTMSKLQSALMQTIYNEQWLELTDCNKLAVQCRSASSSNVASEQSDVNSLRALRSMAVDKHEVLGELILINGNELSELPEFVRQLSECKASADDVVELKAIVECMARVTGISEHKAEQLITQFIGREGVELEHLKRELQLADDKIRQLQLARDQMTEMYDSPYQNQLPYLNLVTETMRSECRRYKHDLNVMAKRLSECVNGRVAQAIQQSLVDKHLHNNEEHCGLLSTEGQDTKHQLYLSTRPSGKMSTEMLQPVADDDRTVIEAAATAGIQHETEIIHCQHTHTQFKDTAISSPPPVPAKTGPKYTRVQRPDHLSISNKPLDVAVKSVSRSESPFEQHAHPLSMQQLTITTTRQQQNQLDYATPRQLITGPCPVIHCLVVGHESAQTLELVQHYVNWMTGSSVKKYGKDSVSGDVRVAVEDGTIYCIHLANCTKAEKLLSMNFCNIIVICYSVVNEASYKDVQNVWLKQIRKEFPGVPYLLVGTQADKRRQNGNNFLVEYEKGRQLSRKIGAVTYLECSGSAMESVKAIFKYALQHTIKNIRGETVVLTWSHGIK